MNICDLTDAEILEARKKRIAGERAKEAAKEQKRMSKARNFHFSRRDAIAPFRY